jgi:hypothetical protein
MVNPFDRTFFRLMLGFVFMLSMSFAILYFVGKYSEDLDGKQANSIKTDVIQIKNKK